MTLLEERFETDSPADDPFVPLPFREERFGVLRRGIFDAEEIDVLLNDRQDFAYLRPQPEVNYFRYVSRVKKLGLESYKAKLDVYHRRFAKVFRYVQSAESFLDIGAGDGCLLNIAKSQLPRLQVAACEQDQNTREERQKIVGENSFADIEALLATGRTFSVVGLFHVLEHILDPGSFLANIRQLLTPESVVLIEIPSLTCPLLTLYRSQAYQQFYFQRQHPFNYSHTSLQRLMEYHQFRTIEVLSFQRYGLENHLNWLLREKPGGDAALREIFERSGAQYLMDLEQVGRTDSAIWVGTLS